MIKKQLHKIIFFLIIFLNILLRIPGLFEPVYYGDECIYLVLGQAFKKGLIFYRDIHDNKPPLLYLVAAFANGKLFWFRLITIFWNTINVFLIYLLVKKILKKEIFGLLAAFLFVVFSFLPEGRIANGEIFMIMPATLGVYLAWIGHQEKKSFYWWLAGTMFSLAFLFKVPIFFDFLGLILAFFIFLPKTKNFFDFLRNKNFYLLTTGFVLPIALSILYYSFKNAFTPYVRSALLQNIGYLSSWGESGKEGLLIRAIILLVVCLLLYWKRRYFSFSILLFSLMSFFGLYGVFLSQRPYPHYLMEIAPWMAIFITLVWHQKKLPSFILSLTLIFFILLGVIHFKFWWYPQIPYYKNFLKFAFGKIDQKEYFKFFDSRINDYYQLAYYLKQKTKENEKIFIWGDGVCIYALANRLPVGRYTVNYHIFDFNGFEETLRAIEKNHPPFIVLLSSEKREFPQLKKIINSQYQKIITIGEGQIYKKF